jgi:hypothetical protein
MDRALLRLERGSGCPWCSCAQRAYPYPPLTLKVPQSGCEPIGEPTFKLLGLNGP